MMAEGVTSRVCSESSASMSVTWVASIGAIGRVSAAEASAAVRDVFTFSDTPSRYPFNRANRRHGCAPMASARLGRASTHPLG